MKCRLFTYARGLVGFRLTSVHDEMMNGLFAQTDAHCCMLILEPNQLGSVEVIVPDFDTMQIVSVHFGEIAFNIVSQIEQAWLCKET